MREIDGETLVYDRSRDAASCLNEFAARVCQCDGETSVAEIANSLGEDEAAVWLALHQLTKAQLLTEAIAFPPDMSAAKSRRDIVIGRLFRLSRLAQTIACRRRFVRGRGLDQSGGLSLPCGFKRLCGRCVSLLSGVNSKARPINRGLRLRGFALDFIVLLDRSRQFLARVDVDVV